MHELLHGALVFVLYVIPAAVVMLTARKFLKIPDELFRKILHFILLGAYFPFLFAFHTWWISAGFAASLIVVLYPILALAGKLPFFSSFVNERKKGEFKSSMVLAFGVMALTISVGWGLLHDRYLVLASVYAWGGGDAFASGVIHGLIKNFDDPQYALKFGLATSVLEHTLYGDVSTLSEKEVEEFIATNGNAAIQR